MHHAIGTTIGKTVRALTRLRGSGGQALPGLVVERLLPSYLAGMLAKLADGVVIITGTNGKTTTTKMVVELLQANGKRVLTNPTGSNFTRGIISSLTQQAKLSGHLPFDIGVFELDEAYAQQFVKQVKPTWVVALNVMRDQLDRFGELDTAAKMIGVTMSQASHGVVVNDDDTRLTAIAKQVVKPKIKPIFFGVAQDLRDKFPVDDELVAITIPKTTLKRHARTAELTAFTKQTVTYLLKGQQHTAQLQLSGQHNFQNAAAALALVSQLIPGTSPEAFIAQLATVKPAFGRGQAFRLKDGSSLHLILVKNPAGFRQALASYQAKNKTVMLAINDNYADGRDVSWLWDVDFSEFKSKNTTVPITTGSRAADIALRLQYDDVHVKTINPNLANSLRQLCTYEGDKLIFTTYTAMLVFYKLLQKEAGKSL